MRFYYALMFIFIFNLVTSLVSGWAIFGATLNSDNPNGGWTPQTIANTYGCTGNVSSPTAASSCSPPTPNGGWIGTLIQGFGDWIDAMGLFVQAFALAIFVPGWYLASDFHLDASWVLAFTGGMYIIYASFISYFFGFRSPEAGT